MLQMLTVWCLDMTLQFDDKLYFVLLFSFLRDSFDMDVLMTGICHPASASQELGL